MGEELAVEDCYIFILNRNFNLSSLKKLYLRSVEIGKNTKCVLEAKLPSTMSLDLEQYEYCNVLDDDDFLRLAPPVDIDFFLDGRNLLYQLPASITDQIPNFSSLLESED